MEFVEPPTDDQSGMTDSISVRDQHRETIDTCKPPHGNMVKSWRDKIRLLIRRQDCLELLC